MRNLQKFFVSLCLSLILLVPISQFAMQTASAHTAISDRDANAVAWVEKQVGDGSNYAWVGLCLPFAQLAFNVHSGAANPRALAPSLPLVKHAMPLAGHLVIFGDSYVWHIAISVGGGYIIHAPLYGPVQRISITEWLLKSGEWLVGDAEAPPYWLGRAA